MRSRWLSECIKHKKLVDSSEYELSLPLQKEQVFELENETVPTKRMRVDMDGRVPSPVVAGTSGGWHSDSDYMYSGDEIEDKLDNDYELKTDLKSEQEKRTIKVYIKLFVK